MSKFAKALEQAERDRGLRPHSPQPGAITPDLGAFGPDAEPRAPAPEPSVPWPALPRPQLVKERDASARGDGVDDHLVSLLSPNAFEAEQYRALRHAVEQAHKRSGLSVIAITSPTVGDGKTTTAINLAGAVAQAPGVRVLLIDADLRRPSIASRFGQAEPDGPALADLVLDPVLSLDDVVRPRPPCGIL